MSKQCVNPPALFSSVALGFSQVVVASGTRTVYISGQTAWDAKRQIVGRTVGEQARHALGNVNAAVEAAGGTLSNVVALRIYLVNHTPENNQAITTALREAFTTDPPASTWIGVSSLAAPEFLIEIEAVAVLE
jgi:enamine deaminase RidA (YjgF/YER057c/UK114 family)